MKIKALLLTMLFAAGIVASVALASPSKQPKGQDETQTTTTTSEKPKCDQVELKGAAAAGSFTFKVTKANKRGRDLVGTSVTLVVPADAWVKAKACTTGGSLTLRDLHVKAGHPKP